MAQLTALWEQAVALFTTLFLQPDWRNILDIAIMAVIIYQVIRLAVRTRASSVFKGIALLLVLAWVAEVMQLNTLRWMLQLIINTGVSVLVVLFQPELRRALEQIGRSRIRGNSLFVNKQVTEARHEISEIVTALTDLSRRRIGALIVVERGTGLKDVVESGTRIDAEITAPLIENIFEPNTPLHDGAMIIRNDRIVAAACILQLSENSSISRELGTRHRAALGISETTDAVVLIVSEETGIISTAREGKLTRHLDAKALTALLTDLFAPESAQTPLATIFKRKEGAQNEKE